MTGTHQHRRRKGHSRFDSAGTEQHKESQDRPSLSLQQSRPTAAINMATASLITRSIETDSFRLHNSLATSSAQDRFARIERP
jgi:hypothetical protein